MRSFSVLAAFALLLAACSQGAQVDCAVADAPDAKLVVRRLELNTFRQADTVKTDASGHALIKVAVTKDEPEFVYVYYKDTKIASLLLFAGDRVKLYADTLGRYTTEGSPESEKLAAREAASASFARKMLTESDPAALSRAYIDHYRESVRYVLANQRSLTVVPVLFEQLNESTPLFNQYTDAIIFRQTADTLATLWPASRYVKAVEAEAKRRENALGMSNLVSQAVELGYPDLEMPSFSGVKTKLSDLDARVVIVHFWDSSDAAQKMFNLDVLLPLWDRWHAKGLEIYSVDLNPDKSTWGSVVKAQNLPWTNVNDGLGGIQAIGLYNVAEVPSSYLLVDGELAASVIRGKDGLEKEIAKRLK